MWMKSRRRINVRMKKSRFQNKENKVNLVGQTNIENLANLEGPKEYQRWSMEQNILVKVKGGARPECKLSFKPEVTSRRV